MLVVIPTARSVSFEYLQPLIDHGARFIVVDDSDGNVRIDHPQFKTYNWSDQDRMLGPDVIAIPRRNGACRDFGFYIAWHESDPGEIVIALDDDERVEDQDFGTQVEAVLSEARRPVATGAGTHFNVLDCYSNIEANCFVRGFPYSHRADYKTWTFGGSRRARSVSISACGGTYSMSTPSISSKGRNIATPRPSCIIHRWRSRTAR